MIRTSVNTQVQWKNFILIYKHCYYIIRPKFNEEHPIPSGYDGTIPSDRQGEKKGGNNLYVYI